MGYQRSYSRDYCFRPGVRILFLLLETNSWMIVSNLTKTKQHVQIKKSCCKSNNNIDSSSSNNSSSRNNINSSSSSSSRKLRIFFTSHPFRRVRSFLLHCHRVRVGPDRLGPRHDPPGRRTLLRPQARAGQGRPGVGGAGGRGRRAFRREGGAHRGGATQGVSPGHRRKRHRRRLQDGARPGAAGGAGSGQAQDDSLKAGEHKVLGQRNGERKKTNENKVTHPKYFLHFQALSTFCLRHL